MPKRSTFSGDVKALPIHLQRAHDADRSYYPQAMCRSADLAFGPPEHLSRIRALAWTAERRKTYEVGGQRIPGSKFIEMAAMICKSCPVQWPCARTAIEAMEPVGTWAAPIEDIEYLALHPQWKKLLDRAEDRQVDVQTVIRRLRSRT